MAKKKKDDGAFLAQVAEEMNKVMAYGLDSKTGEVDESELIDVDLSDKALQAEILKRAEEDLRAADEPDFSPEVWDWFIEKGVIPAGSEGNGNEADGNPDDDETNLNDDAGDDEPPAKPKGKEKAKAKPKNEGKSKGKEKAADGDKRKGNAPSRAMVEGGNEAFAKRLVEKKTSWDDFLNEFSELYTKAGKGDEKYILSRAKIYWNIAHKALGITPKDGPHKAEPEKKPAKAKEKDATPAKAKSNGKKK